MSPSGIISRCIHLFLGFPMLLSRLREHKNGDFVLEKPENRGSEGQKSTKTSILCSKCPKMGVSDGKSAQKPQFCTREDVRGGTGKAGIGTVKTRIAIGKRNRGEVYHIRRDVYHNRGLPANHRARSKNVNTL